MCVSDFGHFELLMPHGGARRLLEYVLDNSDRVAVVEQTLEFGRLGPVNRLHLVVQLQRLEYVCFLASLHIWTCLGGLGAFAHVFMRVHISGQNL